MRPRGIFLVRDGKLVVLNQRPYSTEDVFQAALAQFPEVLAGGTTAEDGDVRRLVLVEREMGVPSSQGGATTWSLDHLFLDETGVPVFVEVKRSSDTRIRREVVGQMLDYAANGIAYWPISDLQDSLEKIAASTGQSGETLLKEAFGEIDVEQFWKAVEQNLREGNVRLVFVADELPRELVRIIEFLNERMSPTEVIGVEVVQYAGEGHQLFVPELVGKTARAVTAKKRGQGPQWNESTFLAAALERHGESVEQLFLRLFEHVRSGRGHLSWGRGVSPGVSGWYPIAGENLPVWTVNAGVYNDANGMPSGVPSMFVYPGELRDRVSGTTFEVFVGKLDEISAYKAKLAEAKAAGWKKKYPSLVLTGLATSEVDQVRLLEAFNAIADASSTPST